ncbi:uncharacterized protein [Amphiura filiformis]|uniref:uncharacterized protein n=1 Tax=Amphiura filiformis TaxID=82378 RepID=UPI003B2245F0
MKLVVILCLLAVVAVNVSTGQDYWSCDFFHCSNGDYIAAEEICNGFNDCGDNSDEKNCQQYGPCEGFRCANGAEECIPPSWLCDGNYDCDDGSDEQNCPYPSGYAHFPCVFQCHHNYADCISQEMVCDGLDQCGDGSDEEDCPHHIDGSTCQRCQLESCDLGYIRYYKK